MREVLAPYADNIGETQTQAASFQPKVSIMVPNKPHWLLYTARLSNSNPLIDARLQVVFDSDVLRSVNMRFADADPVAGTNETVFGMARLDATAEKQCTLSYAAGGKGDILRCSNAAMVALPCGPDDQYAESLGEGKTTSIVPQNRVTLAFTPPSRERYLIIAAAEVSNSAAGIEVVTALEHGGVRYGDVRRRFRSASNWGAWSTMVVRELEGPQVFNLQWCTKDGIDEQGKIRNASIVAIRIDGAYDYAESLIPTTTNSTSYRDKVVVSAALGGPCLAIASATLNERDTTQSVFGRFMRDIFVIAEDLFEGLGGAETGHAFMSFRKETINDLATWKLQVRSENGAPVSISDASIVILPLTLPDALPIPPTQVEKRVGPRRLAVRRKDERRKLAGRRQGD